MPPPLLRSRNSDRARKITHSMLGFARRMEPRLDNVEINRVLDLTIDIMANHARINDIEIKNISRTGCR